MRFERAEIDLLASTWTGRHLDAAELEQATLGWAAGLRLAHLEGSTRDTPSRTRPGSDDIASEYIREELIDRCSASTRSFLEVSCWLPALTESLCAAVTGDTSSPPSSTGPDTDALPILPVPSRPGAFRHPPILARVLQQEFCRRDPRAAQTARRRAAEACRETGDLVTAIELFLQAACTDEAAETCADLAATDESSLRRVDELFRRYPELTPVGTGWLAWRIRAAVAAGRVDEACRLSSQADAAATPVDAPGDADPLDLVTARAVVAEHLGDVTGLLSCADRLLTPVEPIGASPCSVGRAHGWRIRALVWAGDAERARAAVSELDQAAVGAAPEAAIDIALARAWVAWFDGDVSGMAENVAAAQPAVGGNGSSSAELALLAGSAHRERNQLAKAVPLIQKAHTPRRHVLSPRRRRARRQRTRPLSPCHGRGHGGAGTGGVNPRRAARPAAGNRCPSSQHGSEGAARPGRRRRSAGHPPRRTTREPTRSCWPRAWRCSTPRPRPDSSWRRLTCAYPGKQSRNCYCAPNCPTPNRTKSRPPSSRRSRSAGPLGLVRTFLDEGPTLSRRLSQLAVNHTDRTLGRLAALACHELAVAPTRRQTGPIEQLTARELAVLRMLPLRMSNREMAAQLYISVNTLKTHVRAIYRKLDVPHRSAAVHRATALQLV